MSRKTAPSWALLAATLVFAAGCAVKQDPEGQVMRAPYDERQKAQQEARDGKYYKDDGPPAVDEVDWRTVPEPTPEFKPINPRYNRGYEVFGVRYVPFTELVPYRKQGMASWYGRRYHGRKTSSGEVYDMYAMSAAHTVLPIPSYARVTRVDDGRSIIVRVNDRGPFLNNRIIDLSYTAARRLGVVEEGVAEVVVESILPTDEPVKVAGRGSVEPVRVELPRQAGSAIKVGDDKASFLQLGAFSSPDNARNFANNVALPQDLAVTSVVVMDTGHGGLHRVVLGPYPSKLQANLDLDRLHDAGLEALLKLF